MQLIQWNDKLNSGIELIDNQHKKLIKAANHFMVKCKFNRYEDAAKDALDFFEQYIQYHFQAEEAFQRETNYEKANDHQASHNMLAMKFKRIELNLKETNYDQEHVEDFYIFITNWITNHVLSEDLPFCQYLHDNPELTKNYR